MAKRLIRFDWAIKKLLKNKADFDILEGFLTVLLGEKILIEDVLDGEANKETDDDKHNRVDVLVRNQNDEHIIIEVQNSKALDYFHRMIYGTSKVISEYIKQGEPYGRIKKVISVTIAYFDLGQGEDYVYHGTNKFQGIHKKDALTLSDTQMETYRKEHVHEIFSEYWIIKAEKFDDQVEDKLDEWIYFLKNSEVRDDFSAPGLEAAREKLDELRMTEEERGRYKRYLKHLMDQASAAFTEKVEIQKKLAEIDMNARREEKTSIAKKLMAMNMPGKQISEITGLSENEIEALRKNLDS